MDKYDVVFKGEVMPSLQVEQVVTALARVFNSSEERVATLFGDGPKVLKSGLDRAAAEHYRKALKQAGAIVYLRRAGLPARPQVSVQQQTAGPELSIAPLEGNLVRDEEREHVEGVEIDTSAIELAAMSDDPLQPPKRVAGDSIPTSPDLSLAEPGARLLPVKQVQPQISFQSTNELSLAPPGAAVPAHKPASAHPTPDISHLAIEPQGDLLKPHEKRKLVSPPPVPNFDLDPPR